MCRTGGGPTDHSTPKGERMMTGWTRWPGRHVRALAITAVLLTAGTTIYSIASLQAVTRQQAATSRALAATQHAAAERAAQRNALAQSVSDLRAQVLRCRDKPATTPGCAVPVAPPPGVTVREVVIAGAQGPTGPAGVQGAPGRDGAPVTSAQVIAAVATYCALGACSTPPSPAQVGTALAQYCLDRDGCAGPVGKPGKDAPLVSADQVADAVSAYCRTDDHCAGPAGPPGAPGPQGPAGPAGPAGASGPPGRGIASVTCDGPSATTFTLTYSDGSTDTITCDPIPSTGR